MYWKKVELNQEHLQSLGTEEDTKVRNNGNWERSNPLESLGLGRYPSSNQRKVQVGKDCVRSKRLVVMTTDKQTYTLFHGMNSF